MLYELQNCMEIIFLIFKAAIFHSAMDITWNFVNSV